ncbi:hypothetical protein PENTCL1PPCAC_23706, partial [Pristionchus entomophagus]
ASYRAGNAYPVNGLGVHEVSPGAISAWKHMILVHCDIFKDPSHLTDLQIISIRHAYKEVLRFASRKKITSLGLTLPTIPDEK